MAIITRDLIDRLLNEEEGPSLDFKRDQYPFTGASEREQGELLKDILTFANAWRRSDAFIVIGVEEVKGGRHRVVGVGHHLEDANLQQFVNMKTKRPVEFSYVAVTYDGLQLGVIHVPVQRRPFSLAKSFGGLQPNTVYLRRGSSAAIADPDEIAQMGLTDGGLVAAEPSLDLQFADPWTHTAVGTGAKLDLEILTVPSEFRNRSIASSRFPMLDAVAIASMKNPRYREELVDFLEQTSYLRPFGLCITNLSGVPARDVYVEILGPEKKPVLLVDERKYPEEPSRHLINPHALGPVTVSDGMIAVKRHGAQRRAVADFGKILPKETVWSDNVFYIGATQSCQAELKAYIYAENLSSPLIIPMDVVITTVTRPMTLVDLDRVDQSGDSVGSEED